MLHIFVKFIDVFCIDHSNGYKEFDDEPFDSSRLRNRPFVTKLGKVFKGL